MIRATDFNHPKYDVLHDQLLSPPLQRNPIPTDFRPGSASQIRGYPIRWSETEMMWLPYLPAVTSYHYPIFRNVNRSPKLIARGSGDWVIDPDVVAHWSNIEHVIRLLINQLKDGAFTCKHKCPYFPSSYGYRGPFRKRKDVKSAVSSALLSFHHMLAYCSYLIASTGDLQFGRSEHKALYHDPERVGKLIENLVSDGTEVHILLKLLWATLGEIFRCRNFVGVVVTYTRAYDCYAVRDMWSYGVPIYIRWSNHLRLDSYCNFLGNEKLRQWYPSKDPFAVQPRNSPNPHPSIPSSQQPLPPPPPREHADLDPWQYVAMRKAKIDSTSHKPSSWSDRQRAAQSFKQPGRSGAMVFQFVLTDKTWTRIQLSRWESKGIWDGFSPRHLW